MKTFKSITLRILDPVVKVLLTIFTIVGIIAIPVAGAAYYYDAEIKLFTTGSMEPTIPVGAAALAVPVDIQEIEVGDVLTFEPGRNAIPITHRVIDVNNPETIQEAFQNQNDYWMWEGEEDWVSEYFGKVVNRTGWLANLVDNLSNGELNNNDRVQKYRIFEPSLVETGEVIVVEMQGDNNSVPDPRPYTMTEDNVTEVVASAPIIGYIIVFVRDNAFWVFGLVGLLVTYKIIRDGADEDEDEEVPAKK